MKLIILLVPSILSMKVLRTTKHSDSTSRVELLNSDIQHADSWTICGRFRNPFIPGLKNNWQQIIYRTKMYLLGAVNINSIYSNERYGKEMGMHMH